MSEKVNGMASADDTKADGREHEGREADGRFAFGNKGGPGNPYARQTAMIRKAAADAATAEAAGAMMAALEARGRAGDVAAIRLWFQLSGGRPTPGADPDTLDAHELRVRREGVAGVEDMKALFERMPASQMCELARAVSPRVKQHMAEAFTGGVARQSENEEVGATLVPGKAGPYMADKADWAPDWLREGRGMPEELAEVLERCPAWMPDTHGHDRVGHAYADMLRSLRSGLLGALPVGVKGGNECRLVTPPDDKRKKGRKREETHSGG